MIAVTYPIILMEVKWSMKFGTYKQEKVATPSLQYVVE